MADKGNAWIPIADLLSGCVLVFLMMFVTQAVAPRISSGQQRARMFSELKEIVSASGLTSAFSVDPDAGLLTVRDSAFERGSACVTVAMRRGLRALAPIIQTALDANPDLMIYVEGHTDSVPVPKLRQGCGYYETNLQLSTLRAGNTREVLLQLLGSQYASRIAAAGYGSTRPLDFANPEADVNRRVELRFAWEALAGQENRN